jgi:predicted Zn-dependent protease
MVVAILAVVNYNHQQHFDNPQAFWKEAVRTSPHSGYANMMLAARTENKAESEILMRKAYALDPKQKYINFYYGVMLQNHDSVQASEKYLLREKQRSGYYECDFYLARVALERNDLNAAASYLETFLKTDASNPQANNNLALIYINTHQKEKAVAQLKHMHDLGLAVDPALQQQVERM